VKPLILLFSILIAATAYSQNLTQNWTNKKQDYGVQDAGTVKLVIQGTNTFYYFYSISTTSTSQTQSVFDALSPFLPKGALLSAENETCASDIAAVGAAINKLTTPTRDAKTQVFQSIPLDQTIGEWKTNVEDAYAAAFAKCTPDEQKKPDFDKIKRARDLLLPADGVPSVTVTVDAKPCRNYTVAVSELFSGQPTAASSLTATFSTTCDIVTFSGGPLFTEIGNPTYVSRPHPGAPGSQFLSVENTGEFRATIAGLVNMNMPWHSSCALLDPFRLGISTGPVFQNSQNGGSSFGWFVGPSLNVFKYAYISAGAHWGDFPDTPFGFANGNPIPANFGTLTPTFRHTWRFALGITFKTTDLSKVFNGGTAQPTGTATPTSKPAAPVPPAPVPPTPADKPPDKPKQ
jgi:hypothetical protein